MTKQDNDDYNDDDDNDHWTGPPLGWLMTMTGEVGQSPVRVEYLDAPLPASSTPPMLLSLGAGLITR